MNQPFAPKRLDNFLERLAESSEYLEDGNFSQKVMNRLPHSRKRPTILLLFSLISVIVAFLGLQSVSLSQMVTFILSGQWFHPQLWIGAVAMLGIWGTLSYLIFVEIDT